MKFWKNTLIIIGVVRFVSPFIIFWNAYLALTIALVLDAFDSWVAYMGGYKWDDYTRYDKSLDYWWYIVVLVYCYTLPIFGVMLTLFIIRSIGQFIAIFSTNHRALFWFPNVFENYFILFLLINIFASQYLIYFYGWSIFPLTVAFLTKMPQEYILHQKGWFYEEHRWPRSITKLIKK